MSTTERTRMEPPDDPDLAAFWDGTRNQQLLLPHCRSCGKVFWYPRPTCPACLSEDLSWEPATGTGTVHAVTVQSRPAPHAVVLVDLDEGVRVMSNMVGIAAENVRIGARVGLTWEPLSDGRHIWLFMASGRRENEEG